MFNMRQDQSVAIAATSFAQTNAHRTNNITKPTLYAYLWDPLRLVKVGYDYRLYYFIKFIIPCKIVSGYSYTLILVQRGWVIIHYN